MKVLKQKDEKQVILEDCECVAQTELILKRKAHILTVFGWMSYRRGYYNCERCGHNEQRLDQKWGLHPGEVRRALSKLLAIAGVNINVGQDGRTVQEFLLLEVSDNTIRKQTQQMGEKQTQTEAHWIQQSQDEAWMQQRERTKLEGPERLYGSLDGAQVPVGEEWREMKTLSWYQVAEVYGQAKTKAQAIQYYSEIAPAKEFGQLLWANGVRHLADKAKEMIFVCDGAAWIWKMVSH